MDWLLEKLEREVNTLKSEKRIALKEVREEQKKFSLLISIIEEHDAELLYTLGTKLEAALKAEREGGGG